MTLVREPKDRICLPLDVDRLEDAEALVREMTPYVGVFKIGFQLFSAEGPKAVRRVIEQGGNVFLDLKFHDIPYTVACAARVAARSGVSMFNLHASGGTEMMRAAVGAARAEAQTVGKAAPTVLAVTILTSLSDDDLEHVIGMRGSAGENVIRLAGIAKQAGVDGVISSPLEARALRESCGPDFVIVTPGVRPAGSAVGDQKRVMTPSEAIKAGADVLVIGRPILKADDRVGAAAAILDEVTAACQA